MKRSLIIVALLLATSVWADGNENLAPAVSNPKWKNECSACHMAYPPALLPERSWRKMMLGLERHFGQDASLDAPTAQGNHCFSGEQQRRPGRRQTRKKGDGLPRP